MKHEVISLFCGAGGLDSGFESAGFKTILAVDSCADSVASFNNNFKQGAAVPSDLSAIDSDELCSFIPKGSKPVGLIGGPPCQGFSRSNVNVHPHDPRNRLPYRFADLLASLTKRFQLHFFLFENVAGLLRPKYSRKLALIRHRLTKAGYHLFENELDASDFGVPQRRKRLFIVGLNRDIYRANDFTFPTGSGERRTVSDAIQGLPPPAYYARGLSADDIPFHPNHWTMVPKSTKFVTGKTTDGRSFKRLHWDRVSPTVAYGHREIHVHPEGFRRLSVLEAMRLQGLPEDFQLIGSLSSQVAQVSNAVPPAVAKAIAHAIMTVIGTAHRQLHHPPSDSKVTLSRPANGAKHARKQTKRNHCN